MVQPRTLGSASPKPRVRRRSTLTIFVMEQCRYPTPKLQKRVNHHTSTCTTDSEHQWHITRTYSAAKYLAGLSTASIQPAWLNKPYKLLRTSRDLPVIHSVPGKCRISHYSVLPGPGKIMGPSNKKEKIFFTFYYRK